MHWKKATLVIIIAILLFFIVSDWTSCKGLCGTTQIKNSQLLFIFIFIFTIILLYFSLSLWISYKKKHIIKK
jgi:hypothetical protein